MTLPWASLADQLAPFRAQAPLVLAGGLTAANVVEAVAALTPAVADVSSGVERAGVPGVKDVGHVTAFAAAVRAARFPIAA